MNRCIAALSGQRRIAGGGRSAALVAITLLAGCASTLPGIATGPVAMHDTGSTLPEGWQHGVFMEIFVRGYADSDGDGIGDLRGLTSRLDYLQQLGVSGLWLMPITASADHDHGYAATDFRRVEPAYGKLADVDALIAAAHDRGIGVIIDYMVNHSAAASPLFQASAADRNSAWRPWRPAKGRSRMKPCSRVNSERFWGSWRNSPHGSRTESRPRIGTPGAISYGPWSSGWRSTRRM